MRARQTNKKIIRLQFSRTSFSTNSRFAFESICEGWHFSRYSLHTSKDMSYRSCFHCACDLNSLNRACFTCIRKSSQQPLFARQVVYLECFVLGICFYDKDILRHHQDYPQASLEIILKHHLNNPQASPKTELIFYKNNFVCFALEFDKNTKSRIFK